MTKYQQYFDLMLKQNASLFDSFQQIHEQYLLDPKTHQDKFNSVGSKVQDVVRKYENMLCSQSEGSGYGKYSTNLADKFQAEIKKVFPKINSIGLKI